MGAFDALGDDLVLDILSRLSPADIILKAGRICKQWHLLARSQELREAVARRAAGDPWFGDLEPWLVLQCGRRLLLYPSLDALLNNQGRELDHRSFSVGPPGHRFCFVACSLGLVCGRLEDLDQTGSEAMTLAVGNPLTNAWRILPRLDVKEKPWEYVFRVTRSGHYHVVVAFATLVMDYNSKTKDWGSYHDPDRLMATPYFVGSCVEGIFVLRVDKRSLSWRISLTKDQHVVFYQDRHHFSHEKTLTTGMYEQCYYQLRDSCLSRDPDDCDREYENTKHGEDEKPRVLQFAEAKLL
ncbi:hypothetical protein SELMODRAFT_428398 [Selaginella moellendorffii]|uniref:F-box domain-containing protein n=1 Tax=Selaginella moellendorffii TaxID=88036 RepID=D8T2P2_SELML|nr:hypothetical protein SELMODRAFT_428398 [Selaginella moellendorffii]